MPHSKWLHGRVSTAIKDKIFFKVSSRVEIKTTEHSTPLDQKRWKSALFQKESPDPLPIGASAERGVFSNYLEFLETLVGLQSCLHYRGWPRKAARVTKPCGHLQLPLAPAAPVQGSGNQQRGSRRCFLAITWTFLFTAVLYLVPVQI